MSDPARPFVLATTLTEDDPRVWGLTARGLVHRVVGSVEELDALEDENVLLLAWLAIVPARTIARQRRILNVHNSLLPRYRGRNAFAWAIANGETEVGYTLHEVDAGIDTGPIYAQVRFPVHEEDDVNTVFARGDEILLTWLPEAVEAFLEGRLSPRAQDEREATYYRARRYEDGHIDFSRGGRAIRDLVRAIRPPYAPGAFFDHGGHEFNADHCLPVPGPVDAPPGTVLAVDAASNRVTVACGDGRVVLTMLQGPTRASLRGLHAGDVVD